MKCYKLVIVAIVCSSVSTVEAVTVTQFAAAPALNVWGESLLVGTSTISIEDLTGLGGDLENNQPAPIGAALLTTGFDNSYRAEVAIGTAYDASTLMNTGLLGYSYYKETVAGGNTSAAPTLKLGVFAAAGNTGDNFGQLIYEPNWNQPGGGSQNPPADAWQNVAIDSSTGDGVTTTGGWWWSGGLGEPSGVGGPPIRSLGEWAALFDAADSVGFATAQIVGVSVGVGTFNQGQVGYFDNVSIAIPGGTSVTYDFEPIPEPSTFVLCGLGLALITVNRRRRRG